MMKNFLFTLICFSLAATLACSTTETTTSVNTNNANTAVNLDPANMPPGFSNSPVPMSANSTPGIPGPNDANANMVPTGNIPGIPNTNQKGKTPQPKKTPPIPGIPDDETLRRQMNTPLKDVNVVNNPPKTQSNSNNRPADKKGNLRQP